MISFMTLLKREVIRFMKVINQTLLSPAVSALLYFTVFGVTLGSQIKTVNGVSYLAFMIPGIIIMDVITAAYSNTSSSLFISRYMHHIENILVTPISSTELVFAYIFGGVFRGIVVGLLVWLISLFFTPVAVYNVLGFLYFIIFISIAFAGFGLTVALWSDEFEHLSVFTTYLITPLTFFGGVFYSVSMLPPLLKTITTLNPFFYIIDGFRWSMLGISEGNLWISVWSTFATAVFFVGLNIFLFHKGYKLRQ
jgi:ABC-2 type transport system permease protein